MTDPLLVAQEVLDLAAVKCPDPVAQIIEQFEHGERLVRVHRVERATELAGGETAGRMGRSWLFAAALAGTLLGALAGFHGPV